MHNFWELYGVGDLIKEIFSSTIKCVGNVVVNGLIQKSQIYVPKIQGMYIIIIGITYVFISLI